MLRRFVPRLAVAAFLTFCLVLTGRAEAGPAAPPASPRTIVVFGDSQAQGVAGALQRMFVRDRNTHVIDKTVPGTSLSQKQQFDWVGTIDHWLATEHADVAIVMFGGNDRLALRLEAGGKAITYKSDAWKQAYSQRLSNVLGLLAAAKVPVIWLGQPVAREADYAADMAFLNGIYEEVIPAAGADFVPLWTIIADDTGSYTAYGKGLDGETKRLRQDDGVHFTPAGYDIIAVTVRAQIDTLLTKPATTGAVEPAGVIAPPAPAAPAPPSLADSSAAATPSPTPAATDPSPPPSPPDAPANPPSSVADSAAHS
jgi:uncharacterized protein